MTIFGFSLLELAIAAFLFAATVVAIRIGISFDINAWMELRHQRDMERLRFICPHTEFKFGNDREMEVASLLHSPPGTSMWICSRCQFCTSDSSIPNQLIDFFCKHPKSYIKQEKKFEELARKVYRI